jgi:hypothetical protein
MKLMLKCVGTLLVLWAGTAFAAIPSTTDFLSRTSPTLVMDSRSKLPVDLAPGMVILAELRAMENGQY